MKLNNKGFAISTVMYMILIMAVVLITLTLTLLSNRKLILDKIRVEASNNIYNVYSISYRTALEILKSEAIEYATTNNVEKDSIMISDLNSSVDKEILDGYKLSEKYLTMISNDSSYDVYLGKSKTVTNLNESIDNLIDIVDYKIEGNSYQETREGKNLIKLQDIFSTNEYYSEQELDGRNTIRYIDHEKLEYTGYEFKENTQYTISADVKTTIRSSANELLSVWFVFFYTDGTNSRSAINRDTDWTHKTLTSTAGKTVESIGLFSNNYTNWIYIDVDTFQIEEGTTATAYEPYGAMPSPEYPSEIQSVGDLVTDSNDSNYGKYEIPITVIGKNLFDGNIVNLAVGNPGNGVQIMTNTKYKGFYIKVEPGKKYSISRDKLSSGRFRATFTSEIPANGVPCLDKNGMNTNYDDSLKIEHLIAPDDAEYLFVYLSNSDEDVTTTKYQIEEGTVSTQYEPYVGKITSIYLDEPLRCIEDKCDEINFVNQKVIRKIKEMSFTGEEAWSKYVSIDNHYQMSVRDNLFNKSKNYILSNYYISNKVTGFYYSNKDYAVMSVDGSRIRFKNKDISDLDGWIDFVSSKNESGVPLNVSYALSESKEEAIELPKIDLELLSSIVSIDTSIQPSNIELTAIQKIKQI